MSCALFNRGEFKEFMVIQDGYFMDGVTRYPRMVSVPFRMSRDCEFSKGNEYDLPDCRGCSRNAKAIDAQKVS
jgi:hypothetical protein